MTSSSLLPDDPSVLFTTAGMQQFKPYYINPELAPAKNVASTQKCVRTSDIDEVGDESHLTFFEMLGNFSFGGYGKKEAIQYAHEFITKEMGLTIDYVTVFSEPAPHGRLVSDKESKKIWNLIDPSIRIEEHGREDNFWGPTGDEGPCGPTTEIYLKTVDGKSVEVWNIVFNEHYGKRIKVLGADNNNLYLSDKLPILGIDTGMGLERLAMVSQQVPTVFETDLFAPTISVLPTADTNKKRKRIISDHTRASFFLIADGVRPSNKERDYILRRLLRRMIVQAHLQTFGSFSGTNTLSSGIAVDIKKVFGKIYQNYQPFYQELNLDIVNEVFDAEFNQFNKTFRNGLKEIKFADKITAPVAFNLYGTFGITYEIIKDVAGEKAKGLTREAFDEKFKEHQEKSRTASAGMFKGGLVDQSEIVVKYHTATHLLNAALRKVLGEHVMQKGSNINAERLRFDFSHPEKLTDEQKTEVEQIVNGWIQRDLPVVREEMPIEKARELGAVGVFGEKYGDTVSVYTISDQKAGEVVSREMCGGPHVEHTGAIGKFHITKEEAVSAGIRRIKAIIS